MQGASDYYRQLARMHFRLAKVAPDDLVSDMHRSIGFDFMVAAILLAGEEVPVPPPMDYGPSSGPSRPH